MIDGEDEEGGGHVVELSGKTRRVRMTDEEFRAFLRWQDLTPSQKDNLIYYAVKGDSLRAMIKVADWMVGASYLILRVGALAAAVIAVISVYRSLFGGTSQ